jgi:putative ABC transport system substrate-binding protein
VIEYRDAGGKLERLPALAAELVALKVDVIVASSTPAALATKQATSTPSPLCSRLLAIRLRAG